MRDSVRSPRIVAYAVVGALAFLVPYLGKYAGLPFAIIAATGFVSSTLKWENDHSNEIVGLALAACGVAVMTSFLELPVFIATSSILVVMSGYLSIYPVRWIRSRNGNKNRQTNEALISDGSSQVRGLPPIPDSIIDQRNREVFDGFDVLAFVFGGVILGYLGGVFVDNSPVLVATTSISGVLIAAVLLSTLPERDTPLILLSTALGMWIVSSLSLSDPAVTLGGVLIAAGITGVLGAGAYYAEATTLGGAVSGVFLSFVIVVSGGYNWFVLLGIFIILGALSTKFRYDDKVEMGVEEKNGGARDFANVMGNGSVALIAVVVYALPQISEPYLTAATVAFAASVATATADTLSSEIGCVYGDPRLITTFERVKRGTDGGVSIEGEVVGLTGSAIIAVSALALNVVGSGGALLAFFGGVVGVHVDSVLGATLEGKVLTNSTVNWFACLAGAVTSGLIYVYFFV